MIAKYLKKHAIILAALFVCLFAWLPSWSQSPVETLYKLVPAEKMHAGIRQQVKPLMLEKKVEPEVADARLSHLVYELSEKIAANLSGNETFRKLMSGDSLALQQNAGPEALKKWEALIRKELEIIIGTGAWDWQLNLARDFSDRILSFHADIELQPKGKLLVKESITIYNGSGQYSPDIDYGTNYDPNNDIQRGIVRDFPTRYLAKDGFWQKVGFRLKGVTKNGGKTNYHITDLENGVRILIGDEDVLIPDGIYTYVLEYETDRQLIYHTYKDELYWNVNGNGWVFFTDSVSCTMHFPEGSHIREFACYTGYQGSTAKDCRGVQLDNTTLHFASTRRMEPYQGLTVAGAVDKGIFTGEPKRNFLTIARDNAGISILAGTLGALSIFYFLAWYFRGRDPKKGTIFPQLEPPADLSPADVGYISKQSYGSHLFAAALVDMAVKKYLRIEVDTKKFIVSRTTYKFLAPEHQDEGNHLNTLYGFSPSDLYGLEIERGTFNATFKNYYDALKRKLEDRFRIRRGKKNTWNGLFILNDGFTGCGTFVVFGALFFSAVYVFNNFSLNILALSVLLFLTLLVVHGLFVRIMSAYTPKGREIADHIEGFKMYLETAEQKLYEYFTPPEKDLELFEKYLPYAIALGVENAWAKKFDSIISRAIEQGYQPAYYAGRGGSSFGRDIGSGAFARTISAGLSGTVASASTPPSSSGGGSSGGGSSGGGGGGGGGGGW